MVVKKYLDGDRLQKGTFILPNILTSLNLFCGFYSIIASIEGKFIVAAVSIVIAGGFDSLDGRIARATNTTSRFGVEYDSMSDLISFGLAPGLLLYLWALRPMGRIGWLAGFLFAACGALRLARFNSKHKAASCSYEGYFVGLPITAAAGMVSVTVLFFHKVGLDVVDNAYFPLLLLYFLSFLMVSTVRYTNFKKYELFKRMSFNILVTSLLVFIFIAAQPSIALFMLCSFYILSGLVTTILYSNKVRASRRSNVSDTLD